MADRKIPLISQPIHNHNLNHKAKDNFQQDLLLPSLPQSRTHLSRHISDQSEAASVLSVNTILSDTGDDASTIGYTTNEETSSSSADSDDGNQSDSSSSEWDKSTVISGVSLASTYLPRAHKKSNQNVNIKSYLIEFCENERQSKISKRFGKRDSGKMRQRSIMSQISDSGISGQEHHEKDLRYDLYSLFYPFTNLQSLLFSHLHPYIESDYKGDKKKSPFSNNHGDNDEDEEEEKRHKINDTKMDWKDIDSVNRIRELIKKLLSSSNLSKGIKEEELYLMFSSPSPSEIIHELRFGLFGNICDVHIDRFGRRSYYYKRDRHQRQKSQIHFYNHSNVPSSIMSNGDIVGLSDFIEEDVESVISDRDSVCSIARIHYADNDFILTESPAKSSNGKIETQIQWQNYAIHSYLYRRTRFAHHPTSTSTTSSGSNDSTKASSRIPINIPIAKPVVPFNPNKTHSNSRHVAQYGVSITPRMYGSKPTILSDRAYLSGIPPLPSFSAKRSNPKGISIRNKNINKNGQQINTISDRKHARGISPWIQDIEKEGFLEKQEKRSSTNIITKTWTKYWCVLWNCDLFLYKKKRKENATEPQKPIEVIALDSLTLPISRRTDLKNGYHEFRLNTIVNEEYHLFRTKTEFQQMNWISIIESKLNIDDNFMSSYPGTKLKDDKSANSCLIM